MLLLKRPAVIFDIEIYKNFFFCAFLNTETNIITWFEMLKSDAFLEKDSSVHKSLLLYLQNKMLVGFNSLHFDIPILKAFIKGLPTSKIFEITQDIILKKKKINDVIFDNQLEYENPKFHIDLLKICPAIKSSLKEIACRINYKKIQDLPYEPSKELNNLEKQKVRDYCKNDIAMTKAVFLELKGEIDIRISLSKKYKMNLLCDARPTAGEKIMKKFSYIYFSKIEKDPPPFMFESHKQICFKNPNLQTIKEKLEELTIFVFDNKIEIPEYLKNLKIKINQTEHNLGIGGLHSTNKNQIFKKEEDSTYFDIDVTSYYPFLYLKSNEKIPQLTDQFLKFYHTIITDRLEAAKTNQKQKSECLKIIINSFFGKTGSPFSVFYCPKMFLNITINGQLFLLMLIEKLEDAGIPVLMSNTDGVLAKVKKNQITTMNVILDNFTKETKLEFKKKEFQNGILDNVNKYCFFGVLSEKSTGFYNTTSNTMRNIKYPIVYETIKKHFLKYEGGFNKEFIQSNIKESKKIESFLMMASSKNPKGIVFKNKKLGRVVRWVYSNKTKKDCLMTGDGNKIPESQGALPIMNLEKVKIKDLDLDYERYNEIVFSLLEKYQVKVKRNTQLF